MSYLYWKPQHPYQYLYNWQAKVIVTVGKLIGYFWLDTKNTISEFHHGSNALLAWSIFIAICLISSQIYMAFAFHLKLQVETSNDLSIILSGITQVSYIVLLLIIYLIALTKRKEIIEILNTGIRFRFPLKNRIVITKNLNCYAKNVVYHLLFKFFVDFSIIFLSLLLITYRHIVDPNFVFFSFALTLPISLTAYCFISTIYHVTFAYAAFLLHELQYELVFFDHDPHQISSVSYLYERVLKYTKRVNQLLQVALLLHLEEAFIGIVDQVRLDK